MASNESGSNLKEELEEQDQQNMPPYQIVDRPGGRGRAFIAARHIEPGEVIFTDPLYIIYPTSLSCISEFCSHCFRVLPYNSCYICRVCESARFCSPQCLSCSHPPLLCQVLLALLAEEDPCSTELLFLLRAYSSPAEMIPQLLSLQSNSSFSPDESFIWEITNKLLSLLPRTRFPGYFSRQITALLLSIEKINYFPIFNPRDPYFNGTGVGGVRAKGIGLGASYFNHSCIPDTCPFNYIDELDPANNTKLIFRAMHSIFKGSEICISYNDLNLGYLERQQRLLEHHGFACDCRRCDIEKENIKPKEEDEEEDSEEEKVQGSTGKEVKEMPEEKVDRKGKAKLLEMPEKKVDRKGKEKLREMPEEKVDRKGKAKGAPGLPKEADNWFLDIVQMYLSSHMCDCGGWLAPFPSGDSRVLSYSKECNKCGIILPR